MIELKALHGVYAVNAATAAVLIAADLWTCG